MNEEQQLKPIVEIPTSQNEEEKINLPEIKKETLPEEETIVKGLPSWSIEPPIEIKRSNE